MKNLQIIIRSIDKNSIYKFIVFFCKKNILKKQLYKQTIKKKITILKSPHVNKKAQEQFEKNIFITILSIWTKNLFQFLIFLKKINNNAFSDCFISIKYKINSVISDFKCFNIIDFKVSKYFMFCYIYKKQNKILFLQNLFLINKINLFLKMFEIFGEFLKYKKFNVNKCY